MRDGAHKLFGVSAPFDTIYIELYHELWFMFCYVYFPFSIMLWYDIFLCGVNKHLFDLTWLDKEQPLEQLLGIDCFTVWMFHGGIILSVPLEEDLLGWGLWWDWGSSIFTILCCILIKAAEGISVFKPLLLKFFGLDLEKKIYSSLWILSIFSTNDDQ